MYLYCFYYGLALYAEYSNMTSFKSFESKPVVRIIFSNSCSIFTLLNLCEKTIDNQRVDHFVLSRWLVNYAIMSQPVGEIGISRYFSRKTITFRKMSLYQ
jgi:hypothetical protein